MIIYNVMCYNKRCDLDEVAFSYETIEQAKEKLEQIAGADIEKITDFTFYLELDLTNANTLEIMTEYEKLFDCTFNYIPKTKEWEILYNNFDRDCFDLADTEIMLTAVVEDLMIFRG